MRYKGYLIDLDGTMYRGTEPIEGAARFVEKLSEKGIPYLFVTNNSTRTPEQVAEKLRSMGIPATGEQVFTTSLATANYVYEYRKDARVYFIGEEGLARALREKGFAFAKEDADVVIVGLDREVTYEKFAIACLAIRNGAKFVSTNADIALPTERGFLPGNGSLTALVATSTRVQPVFIGKPEPIITNQALKVLGTKREETLMVGDFYDTDILAGIRSGMDTLLVHTGVTTKEDLKKYERQPTYTVDNLNEWEFL
jgi:HAD-superfamily subfamily IIA hydrolase, TIGR01457